MDASLPVLQAGQLGFSAMDVDAWMSGLLLGGCVCASFRSDRCFVCDKRRDGCAKGGCMRPCLLLPATGRTDLDQWVGGRMVACMYGMVDS